MKNYRANDIQTHIQRNGLLTPLDVLLVGGTGTGKSTTLNALFGTLVAKVGVGVEPETQSITAHSLHDFLRLHDSAGLGDGKAADQEHATNISRELRKVCSNNGNFYRYVDLVLILIDGSNRDLGMAYKLLETVVLKSIEPERVIVAINQADMAMKGRYWNVPKNKPELQLIDFLEEQSISIQCRIKESTGLTIKKPIYYSAEFNYNIEKLIDHIVAHLPLVRRVVNVG